jgi:putative Ca2+/H+ antiporter (TMEM165/GDT1 family)
MIALLLTTYGAVLVAELIGDKSLYTLSSLAARFRLGPILAGAAAAFVGKMLLAVVLGQALGTLPAAFVAALSAVTFFTMAAILWRKKPHEPPAEVAPPTWSRATLISFAAIFFPEWGDAGQLAAAMLVAQYGAPLVIWVGATLAMLTKACLAVTLGIGLRRWVPRDVVRVVSVVVCLIMGLLAAFRIET